MAAAALAGGGAALGAGAAAGSWLFDYNRANFQFDQGQRWGRFTAARGYANAQVGQYREDIVGITSITQSKMDAWTTVSTLFLCVCAALSDAGRIGMHGAAPPGWLCALYSGNVFTSVMYCGLALWLSMHGSLRAQCAAVSLRTRRVRLPIPSTKQLDRARSFGSGYEKQEWQDILRVPFMRHSQWAPETIPAHEDNSKAGRVGSTSRSTVPSWIRDEQVIDKGDGHGMPTSGDVEALLCGHDDHEAPEHFKMLQAAQEDWYNYDIYARVCMLYGSCHFLYAVTYYSIGTTICELRGFWIMWSLPMLFMTAQGLILRLDTLRDSKQKVLPRVEIVGHIAPYWAVVACTLEFRHLYSPATVVIAWVFIILCFFSHLLMALRFLDLAWPDSHHLTEMEDCAGKEWWPRQWSVPTAFSKAMWLLAPPKKLESGQDCLLHEMVDLSHIGGGVKAQKRTKEAVRLPKRGRARDITKESLQQKDKAIREKMQSFPRDMDEEQKSMLAHEERLWEPVSRRIARCAGSRAGASTLGAAGGSGRGELPTQVSGLQLRARLEELAGMVAHLSEDWIEFDRQEKLRGSSRLLAEAPGADPLDPVTDFELRDWLFDQIASRRPQVLPWHLTRVAIFTSVVVWLYMIVVSLCECLMGPESLMKPPGEPPWIRDTKRRHYSEGWVHTSRDAGYPAGYRLWSAQTAAYAAAAAEHGHGHRRLGGAGRAQELEAACASLLEALPRLDELADAAASGPPPSAARAAAGPASRREPRPAAVAPFLAPELRARAVRWPALFEPRILAPCPAGASVAALTPRGFGAVAALDGAGGEVEAVPFSLGGLGGLGALAGAAWTAHGLELVTRRGLLLLCPGGPPARHGAWACEASPARPLPVPAGAEALAAAVGVLGGPAPRRVAALLLDSLPGTAALLEDGPDGWMPLGQVHLAPEHRHGLAFSGEELVAVSRGGEVIRKHVRDGSLITHPAPGGPRGREYHAAGALPGGGLLRLALRPRGAGAGAAWSAELLEGGVGA